MSTPPVRSAVKFDLFADAARKRKIQALGDPLQLIACHIDFDHLTQTIDDLLPRGDGRKGGRPPYPTSVMVRILVLKYLNNLSDEQVEYQLLDRMSFQRFCLLEDSATIPDRNTIWHYQQRLGLDGVTALFQAVDAQLLRHGYLARCGQIIDATLVPAPIQHLTKDEKEQLAQGKTPRTGARPSAGRKTWTPPIPRSTARATTATSSASTWMSSTSSSARLPPAPPASMTAGILMKCWTRTTPAGMCMPTRATPAHNAAKCSRRSITGSTSSARPRRTSP